MSSDIGRNTSSQPSDVFKCRVNRRWYYGNYTKFCRTNRLTYACPLNLNTSISVASPDDGRSNAVTLWLGVWHVSGWSAKVWIENKILTLNSSPARQDKKCGYYATVFYLQALYSCLRPVCVLVQTVNLWLHQFLTLSLWSSQPRRPTNNSITRHSISLTLPSGDTISKCTIYVWSVLIGLHTQAAAQTRTKQAGAQIVSNFLRAHRNFER